MGMEVGGAERVVVSLAQGLLARGHAVGLSGLVGPLDDELAGLGLERLALAERGRSVNGAAGSAARLASMIRRWRPDVVHAHNVRVAGVAGVAARLGRGPRRPPLVATFHGVRRAEYRAAALVLRTADAVACVSDDLAAGLRRHGHPPERLLVIP
ncbi:MAG: glycosyltransferase family 4 protein, partial [Solirubrobacteraceae bacterium]